jgi:hypothetical protein
VKSEQKHLLMQSVGKTPPISAIDTFAFYDSRDGRVVHMYHTVTFEGASRRSREEQQNDAIESARRFVENIEEFKVLHVPNFYPTSLRYRVDTTRQVLVGDPLQPDVAGRQPKRPTEPGPNPTSSRS